MMQANVNLGHDGVLQDQIMQFASCEAQEPLSEYLLTPISDDISDVIDVATTDVEDQARVGMSALQITPNFTPRQISLTAETPAPVQNKKKKKKSKH